MIEVVAPCNKELGELPEGVREDLADAKVDDARQAAAEKLAQLEDMRAALN